MREPLIWLGRIQQLKTSIHRLCGEARSANELAAVDAIGDMLDEARRQLLEETQASRRQLARKATGPFHPLLCPVAGVAERFLRQTASSFEWTAAGLRTRLKQGERDE